MPIDQQFHDIVIEGSSITGPDGRSYKACCAACGTYHKASADEYKRPMLAGTEVLKFTAEMRAWNCCHENDEPLDGFPDWPDRLQMLADE